MGSPRADQPRGSLSPASISALVAPPPGRNIGGGWRLRVETMRRFDAIVIGGGLVGTAIGYGLADAGLRTVILDEGDIAYRASRGNFGLVWVQSKGRGAPHYQRWTRRSAREWPLLAAELERRAGIALGLSQQGGLQLCLGEE